MNVAIPIRRKALKKSRGGVWSRDRKIRIALLLLSAIMFFASFRAPNANNVMLDYRVTGWIATVQELSLYAAGGFMLLVIYLVPAKHPLLLHPRFPKPLLYYGIFQLVLIVTAYYYDGKADAMALGIFFMALTLFLFGKVLRRFTFDLNSPSSILPYFYAGVIGFLLANLVVEYGGLGNTTWKGRLQGLTGHPNFLGMCAAIGMVCSLGYLLARRGMKLKVYYSAAFMMSTVVCILSLSRSALIAALAGCVMVINCHITKISTRILTILVTVVLFIFVYTNVSLESLDYSGRGNTREGTWGRLLEEISDFPFFGANPSRLPTSNSYLFAFAAGGMLGFFFFVLAWIKPVKKMWLISFRLSLAPSERVNYSLTAGLTGLLITGAIFEGMLLDTIGLPVFSYLLVLSFCNVRVAGRGADKSPKQSLPI